MLGHGFMEGGMLNKDGILETATRSLGKIRREQVRSGVSVPPGLAQCWAD